MCGGEIYHDMVLSGQDEVPINVFAFMALMRRDKIEGSIEKSTHSVSGSLPIGTGGGIYVDSQYYKSKTLRAN